MSKKITITGDGSWATALAYVLLKNGTEVIWHIRTPEILDSLKKNNFNSHYLRFIHFNGLRPTLCSSLEDAISQSNKLLVVVPAAFIQDVLNPVSASILKDKQIISATKGLIPGKQITPCTYFRDHFQVSSGNIVFVSGPSHAEEVAQEKSTFLGVFSQNTELAGEISGMLRNTFINTTVSSDISGAEYASAMKNVMAIAAGICHGLGYGDNFSAVLAAYASREIRDFLNVVVPAERDFNTFPYLGDLLVTLYSQHSRNRIFGNMIGRGYTVKAAQMEMEMIAEGYYACSALSETARRLNIPVPVCNAVNNILYKKAEPRSEIQQLVFNLH
jgi:glycerol-3-phosphate dehydrogenase (NAD(P)+)